LIAKEKKRTCEVGKCQSSKIKKKTKPNQEGEQKTRKKKRAWGGGETLVKYHAGTNTLSKTEETSRASKKWVIGKEQRKKKKRPFAVK